MKIAALLFLSVLTTSSFNEEIVKRGAEIGNSPQVELAQLIANPNEFLGKKVIIEGTVERLCQKKGCWVQVTAPGAKKRLRITFKDYAFFVPTDSTKGKHIKAEGELVVKTHTRSEAEHLAKEGVTLQNNPDGTATEIQFVATGIELK
ncbi:MAG: DUF4920 domain-containing protein [Acidobacteriota bacterium]|nr:DUF4920 domain-containing protein [Blastocatellia bacterium]MDW8413004.1 DUF4920 domain-containing protein [Acidobacteriota bacterium]